MKRLLAFLTIVTSSALGVAQTIDERTGAATAPVPALAGLGLSEVKLGENRWESVISRNEVGTAYCAIIGKHELDLGPNTRELLEEIRDGKIRTDPEVREWMQASLRMERGRIVDTYWRHEISTGGPPTTSATVNLGLGGVNARLGLRAAEKSFSLKLTYLPTMTSKVFTWTAKHEPVTLDALSNQRSWLDALRNRGLPNFHYRKWENSDPRIRAGLVAVGKLYEKVDDGMADVLAWMRQVSSR